MDKNKLYESIKAAEYVPTEEALRFIAFIRLTGNEENDSPMAHYMIADALFSSDPKDKRVLIECMRGLGKSTVVEYAIIYAAALGYWPNFGPVPFLVFLGASQEGNVKQFFKNVANKVENSEFLRSLLDVQRQTDNEIELVNKNGFQTTVTGRGMNTNWRGLRDSSGNRPTVLVADDILGNDVMTSKVIRDTIETNWFSSALPALDPRNYKIIYIGTPLSEEDLLAKLKKSGTYRVVRFPLCDKFPVAPEDFVSIWPDRFTFQYTNDMYAQYEAAGMTRNFYTEYLLQLTDQSALLVDEDDIRWFDPSIVFKNKHNYNLYIVTDFATSIKKSADYSTIGVIAVTSKNDWMLVDGQCKRQTMQENLEDLFKYAQRWNPLGVGIETSGQQGGFISILQDMMMAKNVWFTLAKKPGSREFGIRPAKDKLERFVKGVLPKFKQGKIWLPKPELAALGNPNLLMLVNELVDELSKLTMTGGVNALAHDDALDLLNQMSEMEVYVPSGEQGEMPANESHKVSSHYWSQYEEDEEYIGSSTTF